MSSSRWPGSSWAESRFRHRGLRRAARISRRTDLPTAEAAADLNRSLSRPSPTHPPDLFQRSRRMESCPKEILRLTVNGDPFEVAAAPNETLLEVLRETLGLTGTKRGCDDAGCGACTVLVNGGPVLSCIRLALTAGGAEVTTIEGASRSPLGSRVQRALVEEGGLEGG